MNSSSILTVCFSLWFDAIKNESEIKQQQQQSKKKKLIKPHKLRKNEKFLHKHNKVIREALLRN